MPQQNRRTVRTDRQKQSARQRCAKVQARKFLFESLEQRTVLASSITGAVYLDANNDGVRGASEVGVPGVQITLTGTDSSNNSVTRTTLTSNTGSWSFEGLAAGTYTVSERQPTAMLDGKDASAFSGSVVGSDTISSIVLGADQAASGLNFGERGILPQYIGPQWQFASSGSQEALFRETIAQAEALAGNADLAAQIRAGSGTSTNVAPVGTSDTYSTTPGTAITITAASGVLANDTDANGNTLSASLVGNVTNGTLTLNANGSFTYTPNANFSGTDTFTYRASDGSLTSGVTTVTITVAATNTAPVATADSYNATEDTPLTVAAASGVLANDTDAQNNTLTASVVAGPTSGTLTLNANGSFTYTPNANFSGTDTFTYRASDGSLNSANTTVTITVAPVNDPPVAVNDSYSTTTDTALTVPVATGILANDTDVENSTLTATVVAQPASGTLTLNANGSFTYTPNTGFTGTDTFTYRANDAAADSGVATVTITVAAPNAAPVAVADNYNATEDTALTINAAAGVLANDTDSDSDPLTATIVAQPTSGTLTLNADGSFTYTPSANFNGTDTFTYRASDGTVNSPVATVTITVAAVNDPPVASNDNYSTAEDTPLTIAVPGVLGNDTDVDGNTLTAIVVTQPTSGTLTLNANGSYTYTPSTGFNGTDTFTYKANDGTADSNTATVTIVVGTANQTPVAVADSYNATEDTTLTVNVASGVLANDTDGNNDTLMAAVVTGPTSGTLTLNANGSFSYTPNANFSGTDTFTYTASDGQATSSAVVVTITVAAVNDAPVATEDSYTTAEDTALTIAVPGVLTNDTDVEGTSLTVVVVDQPVHGTLTLNPNGSFTYTPFLNFSGTDTFTYRASDATSESNLATVTITVTAENDPPVATNDTYTVDEDAAITVNAASGVLDNDTDAEDSTLTAAVVDQPTNGTLTLNSDGSFTYTPDANFSGTDSFTYRANDGTAESNLANVTITVAPVNDAPLATNDAYATGVDEQLVIALPGVLANDTDADGNSLTAAVVDNPTSGTLTLNSDGSFTYTPGSGFQGTDTFTYRASDGTTTSNLATVTITVNSAPVAVNDLYSTDEDTPLAITLPGVLGNDTDADSDTLTAVVVTQPTSGTLAINADGSFTYTPNANFSGTDSFTYRANDGFENSNIATVTITVNSVNDAPVATADSYSTPTDTALVVSGAGVLANDTDTDGDDLTAVVVDQPTSGSLAFNADGTFTYTPSSGFQGTDSFTYQASDGLANSNVVTVTITVNNAPVAVADSYTTDEDTPLTVAIEGVLENDTDADADTLTAAVVDQPALGSLTLNSNGTFTYTPETNFSGTDTFTYRASDGINDSNLATVTITVMAVNDVAIGANKTYDATQDVPLEINAASGLLIGATDAENDTLSAVLVGTPVGGTVDLNSDGSFTFTPNAGFSGAASFTFVINDGTADSATYTASIDVIPTAVNTAPVAVADTYTLDEDTPLVVDALAGLLANDSDAESDSLTIEVVDSPASGTLNLSGDGSFTYTPAPNVNGTVTFTYKLSDGTADSATVTVTLNITPANDAPVAVSQSYATAENTALTISAPGLLTGGSDVDGSDVLSAVKLTDPTSGTVTVNADGSFVYTPSSGFAGTDSFTFALSDGTTNSAPATVTIEVGGEGEPWMGSLVDQIFGENEDWMA